ncbi:hypothetical protein LCGC14_2427080 [marine sediment metagenome]|uniref:Uncharacterized protein n=1 Tax=marine sediment metagenome TaxID=412755 RepID=A0A0F9BN50_9ZZZZ
MSNWFRCLCCLCRTFRDAFDRTDSTDLGSPWIECGGDWSIAFNRLSVSSAGAIAVFLDYPTVRGVGEVKFHDLSANRVYRLICGYGSVIDPCANTETWIIAEYAIDGTGSGARINLIEADSTGETILDYQDVAVPGSPPANLVLCIGQERSEIENDETIDPLSFCVQPTGSYWALGTGSSSGEHLFDDLEIIEHRSRKLTCPQCGCGCEGHCLERTLRYTFLNGFGCTQLDGLTGTIAWRSYCEWESPEITGVCLQPVNDTLQVVFRAVTGPPLEYAGPMSASWLGELIRYVDQTVWGSSSPLPGSTCVPLYLKLGPFIIPADEISDDKCCEEIVHEFFIIITDE